MADPEIDAMSAVAGALADLDQEARSRVLRWASDRYRIETSMAPVEALPAASALADALTDDQIAREAPEYEHFAELFAAALPKSNDDKALVAAYWVQVIKGNDKWPSRLLNIELKNLGHGIPNITDALTSNLRKKPQRVIQIQKSGSSKQATKLYKVTHEGLVYVQGMIGQGR